MKKPSWHQLRSRGELAVSSLIVLALGACTGTVDNTTLDPAGPSTAGTSNGLGGSGSTTAGNGSGGTAVHPNPPAFEPASGMLRRLTRAQFRNALRDLLGAEVDVQQLDADSFSGNFAVVGASTVVSSERGVEQYHAAVEEAVSAAFADGARRQALLGCTPSGEAGDSCVRGFIEKLGKRAWRRPLEATEVERLVTLAASAASELKDANEGARWATVAVLQSPNFIYRAELGADAGGQRRYTGHELASRLSFLVWNSLPDQTLLEQAESGMLQTAEGLRTAVTRLLDSPAGREAVGAFAEEYMRLDRVGNQAKDGGLFPEYGPALQAAMVRDMRGTWEALAFDDKASALELFTTPKVLVNADLAKLYGLDSAGLTSSTFELRTLPADGPRLGILSKAAFLSQFANQKEGSPTLRGKFLRDALLCTPVPAPPGNVDLVLDEPPVDKPQTKRERLELHRTAPACAGCHSLMDPLGLPLETFDAIGRYRTTDHGLPIDPSGEVNGQPVADARDLGLVLGNSPAVAQCLVRKYYTYAVGHEERPVDGSVVNALAESFTSSGYQLRQLVLDVVTHEAFSLVAPQP